jgi:hypothetical protein
MLVAGEAPGKALQCELRDGSWPSPRVNAALVASCLVSLKASDGVQFGCCAGIRTTRLLPQTKRVADIGFGCLTLRHGAR